MSAGKSTVQQSSGCRVVRPANPSTTGALPLADLSLGPVDETGCVRHGHHRLQRQHSIRPH